MSSQGPKEVTFRVELYNLFAQPPRRTKYGSPVYTNGFLVARVVDGCRAETVKHFGIDQEGALRFAASLNKDFGIKKAG
jgi:hypothetical protein